MKKQILTLALLWLGIGCKYDPNTVNGQLVYLGDHRYKPLGYMEDINLLIGIILGIAITMFIIQLFKIYK